MEYLFGKDLKLVIRKSLEIESQIDLENILYIVSKICDGLDYAHKLKSLQGEELNIIHRDISPQNIFVTYDGHVKIIDFGIAKTALQRTQTQVGFVKGKLAYMSPEQAGNKVIDSRSDIFSVGIILYEMVTSRRMFEGETLEIFSRVLEADFEPPENLVSDLPPKLIEILHKSLAKDPDNRYKSCNEMLSDIEDCLDYLSLRPNARKMSQFMTSLFEKEFYDEKTHIVEEMKYAEPQKSETDVSFPVKHVKPEKTIVPVTNYEDTALENQRDSDQGKEQTTEFSPNEKLPQNRIETRINNRIRVLIIVLCIISILGVVGYLAKDKYNLTQAIKTNDNIESNTSENINKFLILARESLTAYRLTTPPDTSAYYYYNEVLKLDPENNEAKQGIEEIAYRYALMAEEQMRHFKYEKANEYIERGLMVSPNHSGLLSLKADANEKLPKKVLNSLKRIFK